MFFEGRFVPFRMVIVCAASLCALLLLTLLSARQSPVQQFEIALNPYGTAPLAAICELRSWKELKVERVVIEGIDSFELPNASFSREHTFPILGLRPDRTQVVRVEARDKDGRVVYCPSTEITTAPLPTDFPVRVALTVNPRIKGVVFCQLESDDSAYQVVLNVFGDVVWYRPIRPGARLSRVLDDGTLESLELRQGVLVFEELTGRQVRTSKLALQDLSQDLSGFLSADTLWTQRGQSLLFLNLTNGRVVPLELSGLLGPVPVSSLSRGLTPTSLLFTIEGHDVLGEWDYATQHADWAVGKELSWSAGRSSSYLTVAPPEAPISPLRAMWTQNGGLMTVESESDGLALREYFVDLKTAQMKRNWSEPVLAGKSLESVSLSESFQDGLLILGINLSASGAASEVRIQELGQSAEGKVLLDLQIKGDKKWRVGPIQKLSSLYGS